MGRGEVDGGGGLWGIQPVAEGERSSGSPGPCEVATQLASSQSVLEWCRLGWAAPTLQTTPDIFNTRLVVLWCFWPVTSHLQSRRKHSPRIQYKICSTSWEFHTTNILHIRSNVELFFWQCLLLFHNIILNKTTILYINFLSETWQNPPSD